MSSYETRAGLATIDAFDVVGLSIVTTNKDDKAVEDINKLWEQFFCSRIGAELSSKSDDTIYAVYSDYEGDHDSPYRFTIGYRVNEVGHRLNNMHHVKIEPGEYAVMSAAGKQPEALIQTWEALWSSDLDRSYKTDFEIYGPRFFAEGLHEVLVHVGLNIEQ